jgi:hypothetical protein
MLELDRPAIYLSCRGADLIDRRKSLERAYAATAAINYRVSGEAMAATSSHSFAAHLTHLSIHRLVALPPYNTITFMLLASLCCPCGFSVLLHLPCSRWRRGSFGSCPLGGRRLKLCRRLRAKIWKSAKRRLTSCGWNHGRDGFSDRCDSVARCRRREIMNNVFRPRNIILAVLVSAYMFNCQWQTSSESPMT